MRKIWIATELFYPEQTSTAYILTEIANALTVKYDVNVVCGQPVYDPDAKPIKELSPKVHIHRIGGSKGQKNNLLSRSSRFLKLSFLITKFLKNNIKNGDTLFTVTNPAPLILFCAILKNFFKFDWVILVHDVFPENTIPAGIIKSKSSPVYKVLEILFNLAYSKADKIIVLGRDMKTIMENKLKNRSNNIKIEVIENWGDVHSIKPLGKNKASHDKFVIQYAGNVGRVQGLQQILDIWKNTNNIRLELNIIGEGAVKKDLQHFVEKYQLQNVHFRNAYSRSDQNKILNNCNLSIITLADGMFGLGVPSKTYNVLAAGKPILYIGPKNSEIDLLVREHKIGKSFEASDYKKIADFFKSLDPDDPSWKEMGERARSLAELHYSKDVIINRIKHFI